MSKFTLSIPAGIVLDDTAFATNGSAWRDCDKVRFWRGRPQIIGGWEKLTLDLLTGVCRNVYPWVDNSGNQNVAFGTHSALQVWRGGILYTITPTLARPPSRLRSNPLSAVSGSSVITVSNLGHGLSSGDSVTVSGAQNVGNLTPNGTFTITVANADSYTYSYTSNASAFALTANPLTVQNASQTVRVLHVAHGLTSGAKVTISGATAVGGITPNGTFTVTRIDADNYSYTFTSAATSNASGGGTSVTEFASPAGGDSVNVSTAASFQPGSIDGTGGAGYGAGAYSAGTYSQPSSALAYPRTWSFSNYGESLMANPRGGTIYWWQNDTATPAPPLTNAPRNVTFTLVTPQLQVMAFGCNEEVSGKFNPMCVRYTDTEDPTAWFATAANNAGEEILSGGGRIVGARLIGDNVYVWSDSALFQGTYIGDPTQIWRFDRIAEHCGLLGPNTAVVIGLTAYWLGTNVLTYVCQLGGQPALIPSPVQKEISDRITPGQSDKIVLSSNSDFGEIRFDYPDKDGGFENSRYAALSVLDGAWSRGVMARSAFVDAHPTPNPIGVTPAGIVYWHERGTNADGAPITAFLESADQYLPNADPRTMIRGVWPDVQGQVGPVSLTIKSKRYPQDDVFYVRGPYALSANQKKKDFRASGRVVRVRFESSSVPSFWRLGEPVFDLTTEGQR